MSPEKGGALRNQSTGGRRLASPQLMCGVLFAAPLLLLHNGAAHAARRSTAAAAVHDAPRTRSTRSSHLDASSCRRTSSAYQAPSAADDHDDRACAGDRRRPSRRPPRRRPPTTVRRRRRRTTTAPPPPPPRPRRQRRRGGHEHASIGEATWYAEAPDGNCASPSLPVRHGAHRDQQRHRRLDDLHGRRPRGGRQPRVVDMSPEGFSQIARPSAREWWTSQSPGDPFRRRHRRAAGGARPAPRKALGQNFVADPNTVRRIVRLAGVAAGTRCSRSGAGLGSLTLALAETGARVVALETDRHLVPVLARWSSRKGSRCWRATP